MTETPNQNFEAAVQREQAESTQLTEAQQIEQAYMGLDGLSDFTQATLPTLPEDVREQLIQVMLQNAQNPNFRAEVDVMEFWEFPTDEYSARFLIERYPLGETRTEQVAQVSVEVDTQEEHLENSEQIQQNVSRLATALSGAGIDFHRELRDQTGIDLENTPITTQEQLDQLGSFIDANAERFLQNAQETSPWTIIAVYESLQTFEGIAPSLPIVLAQYETQYLLAREAISNPERNLWDVEDAQIALGDSAITSIDGDIITGAGGERIDLSSEPATLSIEGADGLVLPVWPVESADTRNLEIQTSRIELQIAENEQKIYEGEQKIAHYDEMLIDFSTYNETSFSTDELRARFTQNLINQNPELRGMLVWAEETDTWAEFLRFLVSFVTEIKASVEQSTEVLRAENMRLSQEAWKLALRMESQRRIASEKMQDQKERVRSSQLFIEQTGGSRTTANLMEVFPMITEQNPVHLDSENIITGFDPATMTFIGSFTPSLGSTWAEDFRTQEVYVALMNKIYTGAAEWPIEIGSNGMPVFRLNGNLVDRMEFDSFANEQSGEMAFQSKVIDRLFWNSDTKSN